MNRVAYLFSQLLFTPKPTQDSHLGTGPKGEIRHSPYINPKTEGPGAGTYVQSHLPTSYPIPSIPTHSLRAVSHPTQVQHALDPQPVRGLEHGRARACRADPLH